MDYKDCAIPNIKGLKLLYKSYIIVLLYGIHKNTITKLKKKINIVTILLNDSQFIEINAKIINTTLTG